MNAKGATSPTVLVVGGSGGLGSQVCLRLEEAGIRPIVGWAHSHKAAETIAVRCNGVAARLDLTHPQDAIAESERAISGFSLVGVVLAGAEAPAIEVFGKLNIEGLRRRLDLDVFGTQELLNHLVRQHMKPQRSGAVVGVLSEAMGTPEKASMPAMAGYIIGKYALAGVCAALGADNPWLVVRTIAPGFMDTAMLGTFDARFVDGLKAAGKVSSVEPIANDIVTTIAEATA